MTVAVVAEKPSMARDIARVLGARQKGDGFLHGNGYAVTWAIGHLVRLAEPHEIDPAWKRWRRDCLPMLPERFPLEVDAARRDQFAVVQRMLCSAKVEEVICATDAGREGELIFRYIYEVAGCRKPVRRLWISSLTPEAIRAGLARLRPASDFDPLADAARGRSRADWLVGMNLTRASTLAWGDGDELLSVGRVQTPTLAMVVERELEIRAFVPEDYLEVEATFRPQGRTESYRGTWFRGEKPTAEARRLPPDGDEAQAIAERARRGEAAIASIRGETRRLAPPLLYDLTELQRHANRLWGWKAKKTLAVAQKLYEQRKLISYPRTDSRHLTRDVAATLPAVVEAIVEPYREHLAPGTGERPLGRRFVDEARVGDHHAILPTPTAKGTVRLDADEERLYDLVCRRLLTAWHDDHVWRVTHVVTEIRNGDAVDRYASRGTAVEQVGWKVLDLGGDKAGSKRRTKKPGDDEDDAPQDLPPGLAEGQAQEVVDVTTRKKATRPPKRFTDATLLTAMETAGKSLDDKALSEAMKGSGLGTPATRAEIIETLLRRDYLERRGKALAATDRGIGLVERVHPHVRSPEMTGRWEAELGKIERGEARLATFMEGIERFVREVVAATLRGQSGEPASKRRSDASSPPPTASPSPDTPPPSAPDEPAPGRVPRRPVSPDELPALLRAAFGFDRFRPFQEPVCRAVTAGRDVLLVMPTGAGKSLCYQLPGLARAGTTLVVSPLIALMEDQVAKLRDQGLAAERIHSGRPRVDSRRVCREYLDGELDFLFIAPERLAVPGFPEMLAKRTPAVVAIDEAHCISHWGHDFRPEYRLLGGRLPQLRPAPVIAVTATATPRVQDDIAAQLGLADPGRFIHGFRRTNIAIEVAEVRPANRPGAVERLLSGDGRRPAIVYAPSRKEAERLGEALGCHFPTAAYHAGMTAAARDRVQSAFLGGELEIIVATIAFGMGVDKSDVRTVVHTALPGTVEGYYQEIGRAGRDGEPSRAVLLYSWADRKTHEYFLERDYPEADDLAAIHRRLGPEGQPKAALAAALARALDEESFDKALEKLWIHRGAEIDPEENVRRGPASAWRDAYLAQRDHRRTQLEDMTRFATGRDCRMARLVRHFGDREDSGAACGQCDVCAPEGCTVRRFREAKGREQELARRVIGLLRERDARGTGQLYKQSCPAQELERADYERVLGALVRAGLLQLRDDAFEKGGETIRFQRAQLTATGRRADLAALELRLDADVAPRRASRTASRTASRKGQKRQGPTRPTAPRDKERALRAAAARAAVPPELVEALKAWRLTEAKRRRIPAFRVLQDRVLHALAAARPQDEATLLDVRGMGPALVRKHGKKILEIVARTR